MSGRNVSEGKPSISNLATPSRDRPGTKLMCRLAPARPSAAVSLADLLSVKRVGFE